MVEKLFFNWWRRRRKKKRWWDVFSSITSKYIYIYFFSFKFCFVQLLFVGLFCPFFSLIFFLACTSQQPFFFFKDIGHCGIGVVVRYDKGLIMGALCKNFPYPFGALELEAKASKSWCYFCVGIGSQRDHFGRRFSGCNESYI